MKTTQEPAEEIQCERCGNKVDPSKVVWLEATVSPFKYLAAGKRAPEDNSQGFFPFGQDCAKRPNAKHGRFGR